MLKRGQATAGSLVLEQGALPEIVAKDGGGISVGTYGKLRRAGWNVSPVIEVCSSSVARGSDLSGRPVDDAGRRARLFDRQRFRLIQLISGRGQLVVSEATAEKLRGGHRHGTRDSEKMPDDAAFVVFPR